MGTDRRRTGLFAIFIVVAILAILYVNGSFDVALYRFGLNRFPCTHALNGGTVCGAGVSGTPYGVR